MYGSENHGSDRTRNLWEEEKGKRIQIMSIAMRKDVGVYIWSYHIDFVAYDQHSPAL